MKTISGENWYTQTEFAKKYNTSSQNVHNAVQRGTLRSRKIQGRIYVSGEPLPSWLNRPAVPASSPPAVDVPDSDQDPASIPSSGRPDQDDSDGPMSPAQAPARVLPFDYQSAKTAKMMADSEISRIKAERMNDELTAHYCQVMTDAFIKAFTPLKARLTELDLKAKQIQSLQSIVDDCLESFRATITKLTAEP